LVLSFKKEHLFPSIQPANPTKNPKSLFENSLG
jgi:hypothetical protein